MEQIVLDAEDGKLVVLARSTRARTGTVEGAAVRDETGRTYAAGSVRLASLQLSAVQAAVVMAVASGAEALEAAAVVTEAAEPAAADLAVLADLSGAEAPLFLAGPDGTARGRFPSGEAPDRDPAGPDPDRP